MGRTTMFCVLAISIGCLESTAAADSLYRCSDGSFTNKADRQCPAYESKDIVRVQGHVENAKAPGADIKVFEQRALNKAAGR